MTRVNWTTPTDLRAQVLKLWDRGELPASLVTGAPLFPKRLALKCPTSAQMASRFDEVRAWIGELRMMSHCRVEMREFKHRVFGANTVPQEAWIDTLEDALALIGKRRDVARFTALIDMTCEKQPYALKWLAKRPMRALELSDDWSLLLEIVAWRLAHPCPDVYLRQIDIPGVHSKFIEAHRAVLAELLDIVLPKEAINQTTSGVNQFAKRYGFRDKPERIRFRVLDAEQAYRVTEYKTSLWMPRALPGLNLMSRMYLSPRTRSTFWLFQRSRTAWSSLERDTGSRC